MPSASSRSAMVTVQAPQSPSAQPSLVPHRPSSSRRYCSTVLVGSIPASSRASFPSRKRIVARNWQNPAHALGDQPRSRANGPSTHLPVARQGAGQQRDRAPAVFVGGDHRGGRRRPGSQGLSQRRHARAGRHQQNVQPAGCRGQEGGDDPDAVIAARQQDQAGIADGAKRPRGQPHLPVALSPAASSARRWRRPAPSARVS